MIKQLTCTMNTSEDFDDKSVKSSQHLTSPEPLEANTSRPSDSETVTRTTKSWQWISHTVDTGNYGLPTRHRRETEDTVSPTSTTTFINQKYQTTTLLKTTTVSIFQDSVDDAKTKLEESGTTVTSEERNDTNFPVTTPSGSESLAGEGFPNTSDAVQVDQMWKNIDYASAINQGQLFGVTENETVLDVVEVNVTGEDKMKIDVVQAQVPTSGNKTWDNYQSTPTLLEKPNKKTHKKATLYKQKNVGGSNELTKEKVAMPVIGDSHIILNRTNRKELPRIDDFDENNDEIDLDVENQLVNGNQHQTVEVKFHSFKGDKAKSIIFITTKKSAKKPSVTTAILEKLNASDEHVKVTTDTMVLNHTHNCTFAEEQNATGEFVSSLKRDMCDYKNSEEVPPSIDPQTNDDVVTQTEGGNVFDRSDGMDVEIQEQPHPNRQRQLTRPQRKSFYPYFFSRMLG